MSTSNSAFGLVSFDLVNLDVWVSREGSRSTKNCRLHPKRAVVKPGLKARVSYLPKGTQQSQDQTPGPRISLSFLISSGQHFLSDDWLTYPNCTTIYSLRFTGLTEHQLPELAILHCFRLWHWFRHDCCTPCMVWSCLLLVVLMMNRNLPKWYIGGAHHS